MKLGLFALCMGMLFAHVSNVSAAGPLTWTTRSATDNNWRAVTYSNGLFVAVADTGIGNRVMTSPDGINWTNRASAADVPWQAITYGNGLFVAVAQYYAVGGTNQVMTSPDGINWTIRASATDNNWRDVTYGNGLFVAVSSDERNSINTRVMTSPDGINWTARTASANNNWRDVTYDNGLFVATAITGIGNRVMTSPDGINWTSHASAADNWWHGITYSNGLFVAVAETGIGNRVMTSPDGINWTIRASAADNSWDGITYADGLFVAVSAGGSGNRVMTSPDGINWTIGTSAANNQWTDVTYGSGLFVAVANTGIGNRVMTGVHTPDLITQNLTGVGTYTTGNTLTFTGNVRNIGLGNAAASTARFCIGNISCLTSSTGQIGTSAVGALSSNGSSPVLSATWVATAGSHTVYFCADASPAVIVETSDGNNCTQATFTVTAPDIVPQNLMVSGTLGTGSTLTFSANTTNTGIAMNTSNAYKLVKIGRIDATDTDMAYQPLAISGNYTYVGSRDTGDDMEIFNISNPSLTTKVGGVEFESSNGTPDEILISGDYAYLAHYSSNLFGKLVIVNISNPAIPQISGQFNLTNGGATGVALAGNYAYITSVAAGDDLEVFNVSNPSTPAKVVGIDLDANQHSRGIKIAGTYAYIVSDNDNLVNGINPPDFRVFNISDPLNPSQVATLEFWPGTEGFGGYNFGAKSIVITGNYAYIGSDNALIVVNIANPVSPSEVTRIATSRIWSVCIIGRYLYAVTEFSGALIYDISNPASPIRVGLGGGSDSGDANANRYYDVVFSNTNAFMGRWTTVAGTFAHLDSYEPHTFSRFCIDNPSCLTTTTGRLGGKDFDSGRLGANGTYATSTTWVATVGTHTAYFCTDVTDTNGFTGVTEWNAGGTGETNNCTSQTFTVVSPPTVTTNAASALAPTSATLNASINPNSSTTIGWFRYDPISTNLSCATDAGGTRVPVSGGTALGAGTVSVPNPISVTGLTPGTTYYFCAIASNAGGTRNGSILSFATNNPLPDLSSTNVTPATNAVIREGYQIDFVGNAVNTTAVAIAEGGWAGVEIDLDSDGSFSYDAVPNTTTQLGGFAGNQTKAIGTYTYPTAPLGNHQYRFNVDSTNLLTESDESNNRAPWTPFKVISGVISADKTPINYNGTSTITWSTQNTSGVSCNVNGWSAPWNTVSGSQLVTLTGTTLYNLSCGGVLLESTTVTVLVIPTLTASDYFVNSGDPVTLTWSTSGLECSLTGGQLNPADYDNLLADGRPTGTTPNTIVYDEYTYTLNCGAGKTASVTVKVTGTVSET